MVWYGMVWYGMVWPGVAWHGRYGMVWYGMVWYGMVWYGMNGIHIEKNKKVAVLTRQNSKSWSKKQNAH